MAGRTWDRLKNGPIVVPIVVNVDHPISLFCDGFGVEEMNMIINSRGSSLHRHAPFLVTLDYYIDGTQN